MPHKLAVHFSLEGGQLGFGVGEHSVHDLLAFVKLVEALLSDLNGLLGEALSVFDKMLLDDLDNVVGAAAHSREAIQHDGGLFEV